MLTIPFLGRPVCTSQKQSRRSAWPRTLACRPSQGQLPPLENAVANMRSQLAALQRQAAAEAAAGSKLQGEMEGLVGRLAEERNLVSGGAPRAGSRGW